MSDFGWVLGRDEDRLRARKRRMQRRCRGADLRRGSSFCRGDPTRGESAVGHATAKGRCPLASPPPGRARLGWIERCATR
jgi:hypothetical protein